MNRTLKGAPAAPSATKHGGARTSTTTPPAARTHAQPSAAAAKPHAPHARAAPPVYRPQPKAIATPQPKSARTPAPPVYRPQPVPKVLQRKEAVPAQRPAPSAPTQPDAPRTRASVPSARANVASPPARAAVTQPRAVIERPAAPRPVAFVIQRMEEERNNKRPSRSERNIERFKKRTLKNVDKGGRTRGSKEAIGTLKKKLKNEELTLEDLKPLIDNTPPRKLTFGGKRIYSGKWRSFSVEFQRDWWDEQDTPWTCHICGDEIDPRGVGTDAPSIDHREPWARVKLAIEDYEVCKGGNHWRVVFSEDVRAVIEDKLNLLPSHQGCNSGKNGPKDTDSLAPQRMGKCPGGTCVAPKAE